jgi:hypothetical protein
MSRRLVSIKRAPANSPKKYVATFEIDSNGKKRSKRVAFGAKGYSDFTKHKDSARKERYLKRHSRREQWSNPMSPGALSRYILWNKSSLKGSISDYKRRFKL